MNALVGPHKLIGDIRLLERSVREAAKGFKVSLRASGRYSERYIEALEFSLALLANYSEENAWPPVNELATAHIEEYLAYLQGRPRWFGERDKGTPRPPSQGHIETQYRRIKRFFGWLVEWGHINQNPLDLIPHPHVDERVIPTVSDKEVLELLEHTDPRNATTSKGFFYGVRDRAALLVLLDTPVRRNELALLGADGIDIDGGGITVMGKGRRERWMPLGAAAIDALWEYLQIRNRIALPHTSALWVDISGRSMTPNWLYLMLQRLGRQAGVCDLHTHRFRYTYVMAALRAKMPEQVLRVIGGWRRIPDTYFRTLAQEMTAQFHRDMSPADRLVQQRGMRTSRRSKGKL